MRRIGYLLLGLMMIASVMPLSMASEPRETQRSVPRTVLGELFTATWCQYCPAADGAFERFTYNTSMFPGRLTEIEWHPNDGNDDIGNAETQARINYYGSAVGGYPTGIFDGTSIFVGGNANPNSTICDVNYTNRINARPTTSPIKLELDARIVNGQATYAMVNVTAMDSVASYTNLKVRAVVVENLKIVEPNGGFMGWTGRDTIIETPLSISMGETVKVSGSGILDLTWHTEDMGVVAFVQTDTTKEVLQSTMVLRMYNYTDAAPSVAPSAIKTLDFPEDTVYASVDLNDMFTDPESDMLTFTGPSSPHINVTIFDGLANLTPTAQWNGVETITFSANDGFHLNPVTNNLQVTVTPVNDRPVVQQRITDFSIMEATSKAGPDLDDYFSDIDSTLTYAVSGNVHMNVTINPTTHVVTYTAPDLWTGKEMITFTASDSALEASIPVNITVVHVNHIPVYAQVADISIPENGQDTSIDLTKVFSDPDGFDTLTFSSENIGGHLTVTTDQALKVTIKPQAYWNGREVVVLTAADGIATPASMQVNVTVTPVNFVPETIGSLEKIVFDEDTAYITDKSLRNCFKDPDGDALTYAASPATPDISVEINPDGTVSITPVKDFAGVVKVVFHAADAGGLEATYTTNVTVNNIQDAPVIVSNTPASSKSITMNEMETKTFNITAFDADSDTLEYTWSVDSKDKDVDEPTFDYTPDHTTAGTHKVTVVVSDGKETAEFTWTVKVVNVNRKPTATISSPLNLASVSSGAQIRFTAVASDPDNDKLTYKWLSDGTQIGSMADFSAPLPSGTHTITLEVNDGTDTYTTAGTSITVKKAPPAASTPGFEGLILVAGILAAALLYAKRK